MKHTQCIIKIMEYKYSGTGTGRVAGDSTVAAASGVEDAGVGHALSDFLQQLEGYSPSVPDAVVSHYLNSAGFDSQDPRLIRLIAIASQKFLSDVVNDALQHCKTRSTSQHPPNSKGQKPQKEKKYIMTMEDLVPALQEYGISAKKPHYYV